METVHIYTAGGIFIRTAEIQLSPQYPNLPDMIVYNQRYFRLKKLKKPSFPHSKNCYEEIDQPHHIV